MYKLIHSIVNNKYLNLLLAFVLIYCGMNEAWETIVEDLSSFNLKAHHGVILIGIVHFLKALEEITEGLEKIDQSQKPTKLL